MPLWRDFWEDETGAVVSAELVAVGTVTVLGGSVGLNLLATSVNDELRETAFAIRSLNQSYAVAGHASPRAWAAGSAYTQPDVQQSLKELGDIVGDHPNALQAEPKQPPKKTKKKAKKQAKKQADDQDQTAFLEADEAALSPPDPVEAADDASQMEAVIEPAPEA